MREFPLIGARSGAPDAVAEAASVTALLPGACDCHVHLFGPPERFPFAPERSYTPGLAEVADARTLLAALNLERLVLVQPSAYGLDNACLVDGLAAFGEGARGIAVLRPDVGDNTLSALHAAGVRGVRINLGYQDDDLAGPRLAKAVDSFAARLAGSGWLIQIHAPAAALGFARPALLRAALPLVFDHFANVPAREMPGGADCEVVLRTLAEAEAYLKLSAPYRIARDDAERSRLRAWVEMLAADWPEHLLWGSDWPHTPPHGEQVDPQSSVGFRDVDALAELNGLLDWIPDGATREAMLARNPARLFGFSDPSS